MSYTFDDLKNDVAAEAKAIKKHATEDELEGLSLGSLDPSDAHQCVYGLMTGSCHSTRAIELIKKCASRFVKDADLTEVKSQGFARIKSKIAGRRVNKLAQVRTGGAASHYSAIEAYILLPVAKNAKLIAYLKGESETLEL